MCRRQVDRDEWDRALEGLGGSFFHCYDNILYESSAPNMSPLFLEVFDNLGLVGMAGATLLTPRWPMLSSLCKEAIFHSLPATRDAGPDAERSILATFERRLRMEGVFKIRVVSYASRNSANVLPSLGYITAERYGFSIDLSPGTESIWASLHQKRRNNIRKAMSHTLIIEQRNDFDGVCKLLEVQGDALSRKGVSPGEVEAHARRIWRFLIASGRVTLLACSHEGSIVGALAFGHFGDQAHLLFSGSSLKGNKLNSPVLLYWRMIEILVERGIGTVDLGGVTIRPACDITTDGLYRFKRGFGAEPVLQPSGMKVISSLGAMGDAVRCHCKRIVERVRANVRETAETDIDGSTGVAGTAEEEAAPNCAG